MQGQLGLDLAAQHAPQLILLDVSLPDLDGLKVLQRLRRSAITQNTPVLMITADASDLTRQALQRSRSDGRIDQTNSTYPRFSPTSTNAFRSPCEH